MACSPSPNANRSSGIWDTTTVQRRTISTASSPSGRLSQEWSSSTFVQASTLLWPLPTHSTRATASQASPLKSTTRKGSGQSCTETSRRTNLLVRQSASSQAVLASGTTGTILSRRCRRTTCFGGSPFTVAHAETVRSSSSSVRVEREVSRRSFRRRARIGHLRRRTSFEF